MLRCNAFRLASAYIASRRRWPFVKLAARESGPTGEATLPAPARFAASRSLSTDPGFSDYRQVFPPNGDAERRPRTDLVRIAIASQSSRYAHGSHRQDESRSRPRRPMLFNLRSRYQFLLGVSKEN